MGTMLNAADRSQLQSRLDNLTAEASPQWGKMNCPKMLAHLTDALRMTYGDLDVPGKWAPLRYFPFKQLFVYVLPIPKGLPTAPKLVARTPEQTEAVEQKSKELKALIDRFGQEAGRKSWPEHPIFGHMTENAWATLAYRHIDHHLRQFGV